MYELPYKNYFRDYGNKRQVLEYKGVFKVEDLNTKTYHITKLPYKRLNFYCVHVFV